MVVSGSASIVLMTALFCGLPAREVPGRKPSLNDDVISVHIDTVKDPFLVNRLFTLVDARDATLAALRSSEEIK